MKRAIVKRLTQRGTRWLSGSALLAATCVTFPVVLGCASSQPSQPHPSAPHLGKQPSARRTSDPSFNAFLTLTGDNKADVRVGHCFLGSECSEMRVEKLNHYQIKMSALFPFPPGSIHQVWTSVPTTTATYMWI